MFVNIHAMKNSKIPARVIYIFYRFVLPIGILILFFIVSPKVKRPLFLGTSGFDLFARVWITLAFCSAYLRLSNLDQYLFKTYRIKIENSNDQNLPPNWRNITLGSIFGITSIPFTWWVIQFFLPIFADFSLVLALIHGFLLSLPIVIRQTKFMF